MSRLLLPRRLRGQIESDALARYPQEACGVLVGERTSDPDTSLVRAVRAEQNAHRGSRARRFEIAPRRLLTIQKQTRDEGLEVLGYYHSHPDSPAVPSARDRAAAWPETSYLIVSVERSKVAELRAWRLGSNEQEFEEEAIEYPTA